jgi:tetratricopeptide (TPR) repeat protein
MRHVRTLIGVRGFNTVGGSGVCVLGADHPETLASRDDLAGAYRSAGDLERAIPLYEAVLADTERVLGPHHPNTLALRTNLAGAYLSAGDAERATRLYEATLADAERVLGPDHRLTKNDPLIHRDRNR